jgi:hypothetical protein
MDHACNRVQASRSYEEAVAMTAAARPGAFTIRTISNSMFVLFMHVGGGVVKEVPIEFGLRAGKKCYMMRDVAHPTLEDLVASLADAVVLDVVTEGSLSEDDANGIIHRPFPASVATPDDAAAEAEADWYWCVPKPRVACVTHAGSGHVACNRPGCIKMLQFCCRASGRIAIIATSLATPLCALYRVQNIWVNHPGKRHGQPSSGIMTTPHTLLAAICCNRGRTLTLTSDIYAGLVHTAPLQRTEHNGLCFTPHKLRVCTRDPPARVSPKLPIPTCRSDTEEAAVNEKQAEDAERAAILEGGSGAFAVRKASKSKYVITVNVTGSLLDIPITVIRSDTGKKSFLVGEEEHPNLLSLVASLGRTGLCHSCSIFNDVRI